MVLLPGESITARIDSDVRPDDPGLNPWDWLEFKGAAHPLYGLESIDDRGVIGFQIFDEGDYVLLVSDGPESVGIWSIFDHFGNGLFHADTSPKESMHHHFYPGKYGVTIGTPYLSSGNTGEYTVSLFEIDASALIHIVE